jgi:hypothetical protein
MSATRTKPSVANAFHPFRAVLLSAIPLQKELLLPLGTLQLIRRNLLQQLVIVIVNTPIPVALRCPLSRRQEQAVTIHLPVRENPQETVPRVGQGRELDTEGPDVVECFLADDLGLDKPTVLRSSARDSTWMDLDLPRRDNVDATAIMMRRPPQRMHDTPHPPLACLILRRPRAIHVPGRTADQHQARILLRTRLYLAILANKVMAGQLGRVQGPVDVDFARLQVWLLWSGRVVGEDVVLLFHHAGVGDDVVDVSRGGEGFGGGEEGELIVP